jgi:hypothetical protein
MRHDKRLNQDTEFLNPNICYCSSSPPPPDPLIGQSAAANAEIGQQQVDLAKQTLAWNQTRQAQQDPLIAKIAQQQIASADTNTARADDQWNTYKTLFQPVEAKMVEDANNFDSPERQALMASQAGADVTKSYQGALDSNQRNMERMGVNPNSGKFAAINNETNLAQAKDTAGAMNNARNGVITQGLALRAGAANFGRNMPNTGLAADSLALNGGNAAVGNMATGANMNNAGVGAVNNSFNSAANSYGSAGQIGLGLYGNQLNAWNQENQNNMAAMQGVGSLVGSLGGAAILKGLRTGGVIKNNRAYGLSSMPYVSRNASIRKRYTKGYAAGGMINGPGTSTSDSIPAEIEGQEPVALSNGEAVLNAEAVQLVGEPFIHNINAAGLAMLSRNGGAQ